MTPEQFCYWLQGKLEGREVDTIPYAEWQEVKNHLETVFHKVTPNYTPVKTNPGMTGTPPYHLNTYQFKC